MISKKNFDERLKNKTGILIVMISFNTSALSLYKWAPIAEELKH